MSKPAIAEMTKPGTYQCLLKDGTSLIVNILYYSPNESEPELFLCTEEALTPLRLLWEDIAELRPLKKAFLVLVDPCEKKSPRRLSRQETNSFARLQKSLFPATHRDNLLIEANSAGEAIMKLDGAIKENNKVTVVECFGATTTKFRTVAKTFDLIPDKPDSDDDDLWDDIDEN